MANYTVNDLVDPQQFHEQYPNINVIAPLYWNVVEVGYYVKIRREGEHFWVQVREVTDETVTGEVYYELGVNPYQVGDTLTFKKCFQFDIYNPQVLNLIPGIDV